MENEKLSLAGLIIMLLLIAMIVGQSSIEPVLVKGGIVFGCVFGAIVSIVAFIKID